MGRDHEGRRLWLGLDAVALMADLSPRDVAFCVASRPAEVGWVLKREGDRVGLEPIRKAPMREVGVADHEVASRIVRSPETPASLDRVQDRRSTPREAGPAFGYLYRLPDSTDRL